MSTSLPVQAGAGAGHLHLDGRQPDREWFPRGRFLSARKNKTRSDLQKQAHRAAVGHFELFRSHGVAPKADRGRSPVDDSTMKSCGCP